MGGRNQGPLAGVTILDLTSVLMGPYATQIFADLGADVIKIEGPGGDTTRGLPPVFDQGRGAMFLNINRGKRSLALDLKLLSARDVVIRLARSSDVFIHSMRAGAIGRLGLGYPALRAANDKIIYANMYGFGRGGPYSDYPAYDDIVQAASGLASLQGKLTGGDPGYVASAVADKVALCARANGSWPRNRNSHV
jgi:crotonobetainyl-CoA:carnitine CoA-transferase CaiB-like acyl-CoA transferase